MMHMQYENLFIFGGVAVVAWFLFIYFWPLMLLYMYKRSVLAKGGGDGPIPINTLYTMPEAIFADPFHAPAGASKFMTTGVNHDTLYTVGWLDLKKGAQVLHVPDMAGRYYSVQFTDTSKNTNFAYVGKRTTGTQAGDYLITGPSWKGQVPSGMKQISSPNNSPAIFGRTLVESDSDLSIAYGLAKQIRLTSLSQYKN
jgi:hypothetical protein